jgi:cytidylate kinase
MPALTLSAGYGTGGSQIARALAQRLSYQLMDRAITSAVAEQLNLSVEEAGRGARSRSLAEKFFGPLATMSGAVVGSDEQAAANTALTAGNDQVFRQSAEHIMRAALPNGAVILGRAGAAALHGLPEVLTVRLFGPRQRRAAHAAAVEAVDLDVAEARLTEVDQARARYVRRLYGCDIDDPELYDVQIDSTLIPANSCVEVIATAFRAFLDASRV